jgi:hypothetical protein
MIASSDVPRPRRITRVGSTEDAKALVAYANDVVYERAGNLGDVVRASCLDQATRVSEQLPKPITRRNRLQ